MRSAVGIRASFCRQLRWKCTSNPTLPSRRRLLSSKPDISPNPQDASAPTRARLEHLISRLPRFLQPYTRPLIRAPVSHLTSFLLLHELTAVVPLVGLAAFFHYTNWLPPYISEGKWVSEGLEKFGRYFRKKGWLGPEEGRGDRWSQTGEGAVRWLVEVATAWAATKALLPLRLILSVWATPWFARIAVVPVTSRFGRLFGRRKIEPSTGPIRSSNAAKVEHMDIKDQADHPRGPS